LSALRPVLLPGGCPGAQERAPAGEAGAAGVVSGAAAAAGSGREEPFVKLNLGGPQGLGSGAEALPPTREENLPMYIAISTVPRLKPALLQRVYALCQARGLCMDEFVNGVVAQAVREAEEVAGGARRAAAGDGGGVEAREPAGPGAGPAGPLR